MTDQLPLLDPGIPLQPNPNENLDERAWRWQVQRRHTGKLKPDVPEAGSACGRCRFWMAPSDKKEHYGTCRELRMVYSGPRKGEVFGPDADVDYLPVVPLRCGPVFVCSHFAHRSQAFAPEDERCTA